ncbi:DUF4362 domain-containing protein [Sporosarcina sp. GW1-11]|uniref:DUF4362 domain-containing protein n=1 Tax=Sporosarcina sp. GW1-11 TaxID=2899126 RepID=UPI00294E7E14|nr:DUF4362 domain-containing protein [Sporosarcina sp. GW1-11]MDV6377865.1 DUF4362 domain-containing protein [Sporosarcina sp. GW1-11]
MKKVSFLLSISLLLLPLVGCQQKNEIVIEDEIGRPKTPYPPEDAIENGDIVNLHGKLSNVQRFETFIENVTHATKDNIRITIYTVEGAPIFYDLQYDGNKLHYTYDDSRDGFGGPDIGIKDTTCSEIVSTPVNQGVMYELRDCLDEVGQTFNFVISD